MRHIQSRFSLITTHINDYNRRKESIVMIDVSIMIDKIKKLILDKLTNDINYNRKLVPKTIINMIKQRKGNLAYNGSLSYVKLDTYKEKYIDLYSRLISHPIYRLDGEDEIRFNLNSWNNANDCIVKQTLNTISGQMKYKLLSTLDKLKMCAIFDKKGVLQSKYHLDVNRINSITYSPKRLKRYAHRITNYLYNHLSMNDLKDMMITYLEMIRSYMDLKIQYARLQYNCIVEDFIDCVKLSDDGSNGEIKDVKLYILDSLEEKSYCGILFRLFFMHINNIRSICRDIHTTYFTEVVSTNLINHELEFIHNVIDKLSNGVQSYGKFTKLHDIFNNLLNLNGHVFCAPIFNIDGIQCIEVSYSDNKTQYLILNSNTYNRIQSSIYDKNPKHCHIDISYTSKFNGDVIDANTIFNLQLRSYNISKINLNNIDEDMNTLEKQIRTIALEKNIDTFGSEDIQEDEDFTFNINVNLNDMILDIIRSVGLNITMYNKQYLTITSVILNYYMIKYVIGCNGKNLNRINEESTDILNRNLRSVSLTRSMIEQFEYRYNCNIKWVTLIDPIYLNNMYDSLEIFRDVIDPTTFIYKCDDELLGLFSNKKQRFLSITSDVYRRRYLNNNKMFMSSLMTDLYSRKIKRDIFKYRELSHRLKSFFSRITIIPTLLRKMGPVLFNTIRTSATISFFNSNNSFRFYIPQLIYLKITDKRTGKPLRNFDVKDLTKAYQLITDDEFVIMMNDYTNTIDDICDMYFRVADDMDKKKFYNTIIKCVPFAVIAINTGIAEIVNNSKFVDTFNGTIASMLYYDENNALFDGRNPYIQLLSTYGDDQ